MTAEAESRPERFAAPGTSAGTAPSERRPRVRLDPRVVVLAVLAGASLAIYAQVCRFGFVFDDQEVVLDVANAHPGLSVDAIRWAFGSFHAGNWVPVTLVSHLADISVFGLRPGAHHVENVVWHVLCAAAAFLALRSATADTWRSAVVATIFAVHPLNVESVAWVAERKNLLSTLFFWLTLGAYVRYVRKPSASGHAAVTACYLPGLLAKPMLVTVPFLLILLDFWPLGRLRTFAPHPARRPLAPLLLEKVPWVLLAALASAVTIRAQASARTVVPLEAVSFGARAANALVSWVAYLFKAFWPAGLGAYYPIPEPARTLGEAVPAALALTAVTFLALRSLERRPYLATGWFWYLGTLVPVIGLFQVGNQAMADRYAYLPLAGVLIAVAWGCGEAAGRRRDALVAAGVGAVAIVVGLGIAAHGQAAFWRDDRSLFERAVAVTRGRNPLAQLWLGQALERGGDVSGAERHYRLAVAQRPRLAAARNSLGVLLARLGRFGEAEGELRDADPQHAGARYNLGRVLEAQGRYEEAAAAHRAAIELEPGLAEAHNHLGIALAARGDLRAATVAFQQALRADPGLESARSNLARALVELDPSPQPPGKGR